NGRRRDAVRPPGCGRGRLADRRPDPALRHRAAALRRGLVGPEARGPDRARRGRVGEPGMKVLVIDVGGTHVKLLATGRRTPVKLPSGLDLGPRDMVREVLAATASWRYDVVTIGYPGPVARGRPLRDPHNLAGGWMRFDFARAFGRRVRIVND